VVGVAPPHLHKQILFDSKDTVMHNIVNASQNVVSNHQVKTLVFQVKFDDLSFYASSSTPTLAGLKVHIITIVLMLQILT